MSESKPSDHFEPILPEGEQREQPLRGKRLSRRSLLRLLASGGTVGAGAAMFGAGYLTRSLTEGSSGSDSGDPDRIVAKLLPAEGAFIDAPWGDVMPQLVELGVVDTAKFGAAASRSGLPLTETQQQILNSGLQEAVRIDASNGKFVLNALWALGLANRNQVLLDGPMATLDESRKGGLASTAGWTLGKEPGPQYLSRFDIVTLTAEQQAVLEEVAYNVYRPCCDNSTAFPDCNHGAAALGLAEMAAAEGASAEEIFASLKGFNSFWYPDRYYALAVHFDRQGTKWEDVDPRLILGAEYSSVSGWKRIAAGLQSQGLPGQVPGGASGCGV